MLFFHRCKSHFLYKICLEVGKLINSQQAFPYSLVKLGEIWFFHGIMYFSMLYMTMLWLLHNICITNTKYKLQATIINSYINYRIKIDISKRSNVYDSIQQIYDSYVELYKRKHIQFRNKLDKHIDSLDVICYDIVNMLNCCLNCLLNCYFVIWKI